MIFGISRPHLKPPKLRQNQLQQHCRRPLPDWLVFHLSSLRASASTAYQTKGFESIVDSAIASEYTKATFQTLSLYLNESLQIRTQGPRRRNQVPPNVSCRLARRR